MPRKEIFSVTLLCALIIVFCSCGSSSGAGTTPPPTGPLANYNLTGAVTPVRDPSLIRIGTVYYVFSTDAGASTPGHLPILCSTDKVAWANCGHVFGQIPAWVATAVPGISGLWAPDISYFNGLYHVYYAGSIFATNTSVIGLATNTTLDSSDPAYQWVDQGEVLGSNSGDDFNAIDPNILIDSDGSVWLTYGSYWTGIKQQQIDPATGMLLASNPTVYSLATRPGVQYDPIEGSSLVHKDNYYYLFVSFDNCCASDPMQSNYKIAVGRGTGPHGPFVDENSTDMMDGGGTILLQGNGVTWNAPGGQTAYIDSQGGDLIVFHALQLPSGAAYLFVKSLAWNNNWPVIQP